MTDCARVLIADDTRFMRKLVGDVLTAAGHEVVGHAGDGREAVSRYAELRPDLVTLDPSLAHAEEDSALDAIRSLDRGARVLVCAKPSTREGLIGEIAMALRGW